MKNFLFSFILIYFFLLDAVDVVAQAKNDETLQKITYVVQSGEGLYAVARKFDVSVDDLCKWNNLPNNARLSLYQKLTVYMKKVENSSIPTTYTVQQGDGLYSIAKKFGILVNDLFKWNSLNEKSVIHPGQKLIVYQPILPKIYPRPSGMVQTEQEITQKRKQHILFFGDSMIEGIRYRIRQYAAENNHEVLNVIWYSSSTKIWAEHIDTLAHFINQFKPTYVVIVLGANELFIRDIIPTRDPYVKKILACLGDLPYVWVGPPNWKEDTGINTLIENNVGSERFFLSKNLKLRRTSDGAHLVRSAADEWMDKIALWLNHNVPQPLQMNIPKDNTKMQGKNVLLQPLKN